MAFPHLGWPEIVIILVIVLMVFGVGKLPQVGSSIGKGLRAFRKGQQGEDFKDEPEKEAPKPRRKTTKNTAKDSTK